MNNIKNTGKLLHDGQNVNFALGLTRADKAQSSLFTSPHSRRVGLRSSRAGGREGALESGHRCHVPVSRVTPRCSVRLPPGLSE